MVKKELGSLDLDCNLSVPETSKAVGSIHETILPGVPSSVEASLSAGHPIMVGAIVSTARDDYIQNKQL